MNGYAERMLQSRLPYAEAAELTAIVAEALHYAHKQGLVRSYEELLQTSRYASRPQDFEALLNILGSELRLITPTDPEGLDGGEKSAALVSMRGFSLRASSRGSIPSSGRISPTRESISFRDGFLADIGDSP